MEAGVVEYSTKGTDVICIDAECQFCEKGIRMELLKIFKGNPWLWKNVVAPSCTHKVSKHLGSQCT